MNLKIAVVVGMLFITITEFIPMTALGRSVDDVLREKELGVKKRVLPYYQRADMAFPPQEGLALVALKEEKVLEVWAKKGNTWCYLISYPILAASGQAGPKLREGDCQVPEGIYRILFLNPNSSYHLSMKVSYPNDFDREMAKADGRTNLGGDIFIHGKAVSIGCIAIGDRAIEELFVTIARIGASKVKVIIAPNDLRREKSIKSEKNRNLSWVDGLYREIAKELEEFKRD